MTVRTCVRDEPAPALRCASRALCVVVRAVHRAESGRWTGIRGIGTPDQTRIDHKCQAESFL